MVAGVEIPALFSQSLNALASQVRSASSYQNTEEYTVGTGTEQRTTGDFVDLSEEARNFLKEGQQALQELRKGPEKLRQLDEEFIAKRLEQLQEQISFLQGLLAEAGPDQATALINAVKQIGTALHALGRQTGAITPQAQTLQISQQSVEITAISLTASFNTVATIQNEDGSITQTEENINIELEYLNISASEQTLTLQSGNQLPESLQQQFRQTIKGFNELATELQEMFTDEERFPPGLYQVIRDILTAALEPTQEHLVDQAA